MNLPFPIRVVPVRISTLPVLGKAATFAGSKAKLFEAG